MFLFKKIISPFFFPVSICIELLLIGLFFLLFTKRQRIGKVFMTFAVFLLILFSHNLFADFLLEPLEYQYPPLLKLNHLKHVKWIVILGSGHTSDARLPKNSQLAESALARLVEAIRLKRILPHCTIILSGGGYFDPVPHAEIVENVAYTLGLRKQDLYLETHSKDTKDEAKIIKDIVGKDPFILVSSASHLPRSVALFKKQGLSPIPAPVGYMVKKRTNLSPGDFFPTVAALRKTQRAFYEYMGIGWAKLRGQI